MSHCGRARNLLTVGDQATGFGLDKKRPDADGVLTDWWQHNCHLFGWVVRAQTATSADEGVLSEIDGAIISI